MLYYAILGLCLVFGMVQGSYYTYTYNNLGCWKDTEHRAITSLEGSVLTGDPRSRSRAIEICAKAAESLGAEIFAVQYGGQCYASVTARDTYRKHGHSTACHADGKGGTWANQVYEIRSASVFTLLKVGCYVDKHERAMASLDGLDKRLDGDATTRADAIEKCAEVAYSRGYAVFGVQFGGQCFGALDAQYTYDKYGSGGGCHPNGKGGTWRNQVYAVLQESKITYGL